MGRENDTCCYCTSYLISGGKDIGYKFWGDIGLGSIVVFGEAIVIDGDCAYCLAEAAAVGNIEEV